MTTRDIAEEIDSLDHLWGEEGDEARWSPMRGTVAFLSRVQRAKMDALSLLGEPPPDTLDSPLPFEEHED